jgi:hypothetical protein
MKKYTLKDKDKLIFSGKQIREFKRIILKEVLVKFSNWFGKLQKNKENEVGYVDLNDYKRFTKTLGRMGK